jgi:Pectate lyase superfamily protein
MASTIDPTKPEDGVPAAKAELRANLQAAKVELEHGGFAEGLIPANYSPPASTRVKDHLAAIDAAIGTATAFSGLSDTPAAYSGAASKFVKVRADETGLEFAAAPGGSGGLTGWTDVKADHGAAGNGSTDDTSEIQAALNSGASTVYFPVGTYKVSAELTVTPGTRLIGCGVGRTIIDGRTAPLGGGDAVLVCSGTQTSLPAISASMAESDPKITFASSIDASLKLGDWIRLVDTTNNSMNSFSSGEKDGFYCMVCSAEGADMYPYGGVRRTLPAPRTGGPVSALQAFKLDQRGLWIGDLEVWATGFDLDSTDNVNDFGHVVLTENLANIFVWNSKLVGGASGGLQASRCANVHLNNSVFGNHAGQWNGGGTYGLHCRGTGHLYASNCVFLSQRHGFECDNFTMPSHDLVISGGMVATPQEQDFQQPVTAFYTALDTHTGCYNVVFRDVHVYGGVDLRSPDTKILGCTIHGTKDGANSGAIYIHRQNVYGIEIRGNTLITYVDRFQGGAVITLEANETPDPGINAHLIIADNVIRQVGSHSAAIMFLRGGSTGGADTGQVFITGNLVLNAPSGQNFLDIDMASGKQLVVRNNVFPVEMAIGTHTGFTHSVVGDNVDGGTLV